jgi:hypothetical protein
MCFVCAYVCVFIVRVRIGVCVCVFSISVSALHRASTQIDSGSFQLDVGIRAEQVQEDPSGLHLLGVLLCCELDREPSAA